MHIDNPARAGVADRGDPRIVYVFDPTDSPGYEIARGKQTRTPSHIFYRPCSGIWQTVWLEPAPRDHITRLDVAAGADGGGKRTLPVAPPPLREPKLLILPQSQCHCLCVRQPISAGGVLYPSRRQRCRNERGHLRRFLRSVRRLPRPVVPRLANPVQHYRPPGR